MSCVQVGENVEMTGVLEESDVLCVEHRIICKVMVKSICDLTGKNLKKRGLSHLILTGSVVYYGSLQFICFESRFIF